MAPVLLSKLRIKQAMIRGGAASPDTDFVDIQQSLVLEYCRYFLCKMEVQTSARRYNLSLHRVQTAEL